MSVFGRSLGTSSGHNSSRAHLVGTSLQLQQGILCVRSRSAGVITWPPTIRGCAFASPYNEYKRFQHAKPYLLQALIDMLDSDGEIIEHLAGAEDFMLAEALHEAAIKRWSKAPILLRQASWVVRDSRRPRLVK
jgi:hypothetical protein